MTQTIERSLARLMGTVELDRPALMAKQGGGKATVTLSDIVTMCWHADEVIRLIRLGYMAPRLLTESERFIFNSFIGSTHYYPNGQGGGEVSFLGQDDVFEGVAGLSGDYLNSTLRFDLETCRAHLPSMRENLLYLYESSAINLDKPEDWGSFS